MNRKNLRYAVLCLLSVTFCLLASASSLRTPDSGLQAAEASDREQPERYRKFESMLSGSKLVGHFTVVGKPLEKLAGEEYTIRSVSKLPRGNFWLFQARIRYGDKDVTVPLPLEVLWAGDTPVITLSDLAIPGLGTFSARVVFHDAMYAGTWRHGDVVGHLFGEIRQPQAAAEAEGAVEPAGEEGSTVSPDSEAR